MIHSMYITLSKFFVAVIEPYLENICFVIGICNLSFNNAKDAPQEEVLLSIYIHHSEIHLLKRCGDKTVLQI